MHFQELRTEYGERKHDAEGITVKKEHPILSDPAQPHTLSPIRTPTWWETGNWLQNPSILAGTHFAKSRED